MKQFAALLICLIATAAWGKTTLRIPVVTEEGRTAAELNVELKAKGLPLVPTVLEISTANTRDAYKKHDEVSVAVAQATKALGKEDYLRSEVIPNSDLRGTCYTGQAGQAVVDLVFALAGSFYTEQMNLWGWKYKSQKSINTGYAEDVAETEKLLEKRSKLWREWRGSGEAMLLVIAYSDDGDDMNEALIYKCKE